MKNVLLKVLAMSMVLGLLAKPALSATGWQEITPTSGVLAIDIYGGPGYYYNPSKTFVRIGQQIGFTIDTIYLEAQVRFDSGSWQTVKTCGSGCIGYFLVTHPWVSAGTKYMEMRWRGEDGMLVNPRTFTVYVVPGANRAFKDSAGNTMTLWEGGNSQLDKPFIVIEGFYPTNDNFPEKYYKLGENLFSQARSLGQDMIIFNFAQGGIDMAVNAQHVTDGINYINSIKSGSNKIRVAGVSMGGVIARYALAKAEAAGAALNVSHFASVDAPQQDAVMDYDLMSYLKSNHANHPSLNSIAAKQLLRRTPFDPSSSYHNNFYTILRFLNEDGYPHLTKNIGVSFSPNSPNPYIGLWLKIKVKTDLGIFDKDYEIDAGEPTAEAGSYLPIESTEIWGREKGLYYELIRYRHPTFVPHKSALDLNAQGVSKFTVRIASTAHRFHNEIPNDVVDPLIDALELRPPLTASITGPATRTVGQSGTWTAGVSGGKSPYTYTWSFLLQCHMGAATESYHDGGDTPDAENCGVWNVGGTASSFTKSFSGNWDVQLRLVVKDGSNPVQTKTVLKNVTVGSGSGGPLAMAAGKQAQALATAERAVPQTYALEPNYPNPFNPSTTIRFDLPEAVHVRLVVYDLMGRAVQRLVDGEMAAGSYEALFDGAGLPSGTYLFRMTAGSFTRTGRMMLLK